MATNVDSDTLRLMPSPARSRRGVKGSVALLKDSVQLGCVSQDSHPSKSILREEGKLGPNHTVKFSQGTWHHIQKFWKERVHREASFKSANLTSAIRALPDLRMAHFRKPCNKKDAPAEKHWTWRKMSTSSKKTKATFFSSTEAWVMSAPSSKKPEEREFVVDSEASVHMLSKKASSSDELDTLRRCMTTTVVVTANGEANKRGSTSIRSRSWSLRDSANYSMTRLQFHHMENSAKNTDILVSGPAVKNHGWPNKVRRFSARRKTSYLLLSLDCRQILVQVRPLHRHRRTRQAHLQVQHQSEVTHPHQETGAIHQNSKKGHQTSLGRPFARLSRMSEEINENLEDTGGPVPAHIFHDSDSERPTRVTLRKHSFYTHFPKDRNRAVCLRTKMTRAPCRRRTGEAELRAEKFGDSIAADHKVLNEEGESRNNHWYADVVQDVVTQWIQSYPCKTKTSQETDKSLRKFLEPQKSRKLFFTLTIRWNLANHVKIYHGLTELRHLIDPRRKALLKEWYAE